MTHLTTQDSIFLIAEDLGSTAHIGWLNIFQIPEGYRGDFVRDLHRELKAAEVGSLFRRRLETPLIGTPRWVEYTQFDLDYHLRLSALPEPGNEQDLLTRVEQLHERRLDRRRPLWECHLIEGLQGRRFALYFKMHHACIDGMGVIGLIQDSLSSSPDDPAVRPLWGSWSDEEAEPRSWSSLKPLLEEFSAQVRGRLTEGAELAGEVAKMILQALGLRASEMPLPLDAPHTPFNVEIGDARRFAIAQLPLDRVKAIGKPFDGTINDVVMAVCAGALRRYLENRGQLPEKPLLAGVPMAVRREGSGPIGNQVVAGLVGLATDIADPRARLRKIVASSTEAKDHIMHDMSLVAVQDFMLAIWAITLLTEKLSANLPISNMPGPRNALYLKGARLVAIYPVSMLGQGTALNITLNSYEDTLFFGLIADPEAVPELDTLAEYLEDAFAELENVVLGHKASAA